MHLNQILISPSKRLAAILGGFCFGVLVGPLSIEVPFAWMIGLLAVLAIVFVFTRIPSLQRGDRGGSFVTSAQAGQTPPNLPLARGGVFVCILFAFLLGILRYTQSEIPSSVVTVAERTGQTIRVEGIVRGEVEQKINGQSVVLDRVRVADEPVDGKLLVRMSLYPIVQARDHIQLSCRIEQPEPFSGFAYDRFLKSKGILATCSFPQYIDVRRSTTFSFLATLLAIKRTLIDDLRAVVTEPHATFLAGLLFGGGSSLSQNLQDDFSKTGTSHILAASGFNVSLFSVAFLGWILTTNLKRRNSLIVAAALLIVYMLIAGATPSIVRATLMAGLVLVQHAVRREPYRLNMLLLAASVMLVANPRILLDDPGFQLSFIATAGILYLVPAWKDRFDFLPDRYGIRESFVASLVASVATFPITLWHFGTISLISPLVNILVLPLVPYAMVFTTAAIAASLVSTTLGQVVALPAFAFSSVMLQLITIFGSLF